MGKEEKKDVANKNKGVRTKTLVGDTFVNKQSLAKAAKEKIRRKVRKSHLKKTIKHKSKNSKKPKEVVSTKAKVKSKGLVKKPKTRKPVDKTKKNIKKTKQKVAKKTRKKVKKPLSKKTTRKVIKKKSTLSLDKPPGNPIISPEPENDWEAWQTFNPGVILLGNKVHFLYRAIGSDGISRFGYAVSTDGFVIDERSPQPVYEHNPQQHQFNIYSYFSGGSWGGCEDPRLVRVDNEDVIYMTYTACDEGLRVALTSIKVNDFLNKKWNWKPAKLISPPGEVHKNWVIFPEKIKGKYAILHSISPKISIDYVDDLEFSDKKYIQSCYEERPAKTSKHWDNWVRGVGPPPLKTEYGWLVLYHAIDDKDPGKYKVGAMLLNLKNPEKIICKAKQPILEPEEYYENNGYKAGVVYASGAIIKNNNLIIYYGGADSHVCVAYTDLNKFLKELKKGVKPKLKKKTLGRKSLGRKRR